MVLRGDYRCNGVFHCHDKSWVQFVEITMADWASIFDSFDSYVQGQDGASLLSLASAIISYEATI